MIKIPVTCGRDALDQMVAYTQAHQMHSFFMVCDENTHPVLGQRAEALLRANGADVKVIMLKGPEVIADEANTMEVLLEAGAEERTYIAVGAGTLTDITRFAAHRCRLPFLSLPTAPSVDGFTSVGAPMVFRRFKQTVPCKAPEAVFADLDTLCSAPRAMIAAGVGDMLGKYTALADWRLGELIHDEIYNYDAAVAQRSARALKSVVEQSDAIARAGEEGVAAVFNGLIETGLCIMEVGHACPAAGAEHHLSHYLEMRLLKENRPAVLHGSKVGYATVLVSQRYRQIERLSRADVQALLRAAPPFSTAAEIELIRAEWGACTDLVLVQQRRMLEVLERNEPLIRRRIVEHWDDVLEIAKMVPPPEELLALLAKVGGPTCAADITFDEETVQTSLNKAHYLRDRITVVKLGHLLRLW